MHKAYYLASQPDPLDELVMAKRHDEDKDLPLFEEMS